MGILAKAIVKKFGETPVIRGIDLEVKDGELVALLGPSGGGKSTLLRLIAGLESLDSGEVWLDGRRVDHLDAASRGVGFVFQHYALFRHMTVLDNVAFGVQIRGGAREEARARAESLLQRVGLGGLGRRWPDELSGGQRQRVALARALAPEPRLLLLDEPFGALDARVRADLRQWLRHLHDDLGATTVLVTHDQEEALAVADRVVIVREGQVEQDGTPEELLDAPRSEFVARFVGEVNVLEGVVHQVGRARAASLDLEVSPSWPVGQALRLVIRSYELALRAHPEGPAHVRRIVPVDDRARVEVEVGDRTLIARMDREALRQAGLAVGDRVRLSPSQVRAWPVGP